MQKRGAIWIAAILYIAVGIIVIAIIMGAALPVVNKIKDKNTYIQTKEVLSVIDETIRTVAKEGPGSQRELNPLTIKSGRLNIIQNEDKIEWSMETNADLVEPGVKLKEGNLNIELSTTPQVGKYIMKVHLIYDTIYDIKLNSQYQPPYQGTYTVLIKHTGQYSTIGPVSNVPLVEVTIK